MVGRQFTISITILTTLRRQVSVAKPFVESAAQAAHGHGGHNMISSSPRVIHGPGVETLNQKKHPGHITPYEDSTGSMKKKLSYLDGLLAA
jgi:hypothetical protein